LSRCVFDLSLMKTVADDIVIRLEGVWKRYGLLPALKDCWRALRAGDGLPGDHGHWALRDINLEMRRGETLGIIGRNGAGKSTLLKVLAGVTPVTRGGIEIRGRVFPMIELNAGLHLELTGRENVYLLGAIMGFSRREVQTKMPEIEEFCELGEFFDKPVRTYSSGMLARLGFAVAVNVDADILLIDEVLAVGDLAFQKKCLDRVSALISRGTTMILVSHSPYQIERMCNEAILLHQGAVVKQGDPGEVARTYFNVVNELAVGNVKSSAEADLNRPGSGQLRITKVQVLDKHGHETDCIQTTDPVTFRLHMRVYERVAEPSIGIRIFDGNNTMVACLSMAFEHKGVVIEKDGYVDCHIHSFNFMPNLYYLQIKITSGVMLDAVENAATFKVNAPPDVILRTGNKGIAFADAEWYFYSAVTPRRIPALFTQEGVYE
jgi:lipopolysaccharide transport system ATP-binding protein